MKPSWNILVIEADEEDFILVRDSLKKMPGAKCNVGWASTYWQGVEALAKANWDVVLMNDDLGTHSGFELTRKAVSLSCRIPIILVTRERKEELARQAWAAGAVDCLPKSELTAAALKEMISEAISASS